MITLRSEGGESDKDKGGRYKDGRYKDGRYKDGRDKGGRYKDGREIKVRERTREDSLYYNIKGKVKYKI